MLEFAVARADGRRIVGQTPGLRLGIEALRSIRQGAFNNKP